MAVIAFVSSTDSPLAKAVTEAANANDDMPFALSTSDAVRAMASPALSFFETQRALTCSRVVQVCDHRTC